MDSNSLPPPTIPSFTRKTPAESAMDETINETIDRLTRLTNDVSEMSNKIVYLRDIRPRALSLLAQADTAEEEANRLDSEKVSLEKEIERLKTVVMRMEDMRFSTKQLTDQMLDDTAAQMRHMRDHGKSIVPRLPSMRMSAKRTISDEGSTDTQAPLFKVPRRDTSEPTTSSPQTSLSPPTNTAIPIKLSPGSRSNSGAGVFVDAAGLVTALPNSSRPTVASSSLVSQAPNPQGLTSSILATSVTYPPVTGSSTGLYSSSYPTPSDTTVSTTSLWIEVGNDGAPQL